MSAQSLSLSKNTIKSIVYLPSCLSLPKLLPTLSSRDHPMGKQVTLAVLEELALMNSSPRGATTQNIIATGLPPNILKSSAADLVVTSSSTLQP